MRASRKLVYALFAGLLIFGTVSCGGDEEETTATTAGGTATTSAGAVGGAAQTVEVDAENIMFSPTSITVKKGTTVRWTNKDSVLHTVTSGADRNADGKFDGTLTSAGDTFSYTFNDVGTFEYYCKPHARMNGTVIVTE